MADPPKSIQHGGEAVISSKWLTLPRPSNMAEKRWNFGTGVTMVAI